MCSYSWRVPPGVWGELKIVPAIEWSGDIGELGINEGTAAVCNWKWYHSVPSLALWVVLAIAIVLVRDNRDPRILLIFIPILVVNLLWSWFQGVLGAPPSSSPSLACWSRPLWSAWPCFGSWRTSSAIGIGSSPSCWRFS